MVTHVDFVGYHSSRQPRGTERVEMNVLKLFRNVQTVTLDIAIDDLIMHAGGSGHSLGWCGVDDVEKR